MWIVVDIEFYFASEYIPPKNFTEEIRNMYAREDLDKSRIGKKFDWKFQELWQNLKCQPQKASASGSHL